MAGLGTALALMLAPGLAAQGTAVVHGTVRDSATGGPLQGAQVTSGATLAATDAAGHYIFTRVPAGKVVIAVRRLGYDSASALLTLAAGDSIRRDFTLAPHSVSLEPVVVTAGKRSQLLDQVVTSIAIVSDTAIARRAVNTVDEAVDKAPGVQMLNGQINIRGSSGYVLGFGSRVLLLVDGVPANQGDRGGIDWDMIPLEEIERVEIVKGAGSSLYGSAALGGVANLITREIPRGVHARVRATGGSVRQPGGCHLGVPRQDRSAGRRTGQRVLRRPGVTGQPLGRRPPLGRLSRTRPQRQLECRWARPSGSSPQPPGWR